MRRVWYMPPWSMTGPAFGVPGSRPPVWFGGDENGRRTIVLQVPLLGGLVVALTGTATQQPHPGMTADEVRENTHRPTPGAAQSGGSDRG